MPSALTVEAWLQAVLDQETNNLGLSSMAGSSCDILTPSGIVRGQPSGTTGDGISIKQLSGSAGSKIGEWVQKWCLEHKEEPNPTTPCKHSNPSRGRLE